jgi:threonine dehydrogenase-like Zn-dependent dehydrogenase
MDPEWLPVMALFLAGLFAGGIAVYCIRSRETRKGLALLVAGTGMIALALIIVRQRSFTALLPRL